MSEPEKRGRGRPRKNPVDPDAPQTEAEIVRDILAYLDSLGIHEMAHDCEGFFKPAARGYRWRVSLGALPGISGRAPRPNPMRGHPDIAILLRHGQYLVIEAKTKTGRLSEIQVKWRERITALGTVYILARSVEDVRRTLEPIVRCV